MMLPPYGDGGFLLCLSLCINDRRTWSSCDVPVNGVMRVSSAVGGLRLWRVHNMQYIPACHGLPFGTWSTLAVSGGVVFCLEGVCPGLPRSPAQ